MNLLDDERKRTSKINFVINTIIYNEAENNQLLYLIDCHYLLHLDKIISVTHTYKTKILKTIALNI